MDNVVTIISDSFETPMLIINEKLAEKLKLTGRNRGSVSFGTQKSHVYIKVSEKTDEKEMILSQSVMDDLHIPDYPTYEIRIVKNEIVIGPCIGIAASHKDKNITKRYLEKLSLNVLDYPRIRGAVIVFPLDKVDKTKKLVEGYCYNPKSNSWDKGIFPYPLAIYEKTNLKEKWQDHFTSVIGDAIFNNYVFSKWDMYKWFSKENDILPNLPFTKLYHSKEDIYDMLEKCKVIYAKPIKGMKGYGVIRISLEDGRVDFKYRKDDENIKISQEDRKEVDKTIEELFGEGKYIVQQGLDLLTYNGGVVDFRCVMQKNEAREWVCNTIVARTGASGSVVSNISSGGAAMPGMELIREALSISESEIFIFKERIMSLCMKVCRALDKYGFNYGTLGMDLGIDKDMNIWLIEVNNRRPHPAIALRANEILSYYTILASPLYYGKALAGFGYKEVERDVL